MTRFAVAVMFGAGLTLLAACGRGGPEAGPGSSLTTSSTAARTSSPVGSSTPVRSTATSATPTPSSSSTNASDPGSWQVSVTGYGPLTVGMTSAQLRAAVGPTLKIEQAGAGASCLLGHSPRLPDVTLGIVNDRFTTTMVGAAPGPATGGPSTPSGIHLGMAEAAVKKALGPSARTEQPTSTMGIDYRLDVSHGQAEVLVQSGIVTFFAEGSKAFGEDGCV